MATDPHRHPRRGAYGLASDEAVTRIDELLTAQKLGQPVEQCDLIRAFDRAAHEHVAVLRSTRTGRRTAQREDGAYYTPPALAEELVGRALARLRPQANPLPRCLDPAVGTGVFLVAFMRQAFGLLYRCDPDKAGLLRRLAIECVHGADTDPTSVRLARAAVLIAVGELASMHGLTLPSGELASAVRRNIIVADSLAGGPCLVTYPLSPDRPFDLIASNPPFVSYSGREACTRDLEQWRRIRGRYSVARGWPGLAPLFVELAHSLLAEGGVMAMVVPGAMLHQPAYAPARELLSGGFERIDAALLPEDVFPQVTSAVATVVCTKAAGARPATGAPLMMSAPDSFWSRVRSRTGLVPLGRVAHVRDVGIHTGNVRAKVLREASSGEHCVPVLRGRDVMPFRIGPAVRHCDLSPRLEKGETMRVSLPEAYEREKILIRQTARRPICAVDRGGRYFLNSLLAIYPKCDPDALCALLNSDCMSECYAALFPEARQRAFPQVKKAYLDALPVPKELLDPDSSVAWELGLLGRRLAEARGAEAAAMQRLNELVWRLYGAGV